MFSTKQSYHRTSDRYATFCQSLSQKECSHIHIRDLLQKQSKSRVVHEVSPCSPSGGDSGNCTEIPALSAHQTNEKKLDLFFGMFNMISKKI